MDQDFLDNLMNQNSFRELYEKLMDKDDDNIEDMKELLRFTGMIFDLIDIRLSTYAEITRATVGDGTPDTGVYDHVKRIFRTHIINELEKDELLGRDDDDNEEDKDKDDDDKK